MGGRKKLWLNGRSSLSELFLCSTFSECTFHVIRCACCTRIFRNNVNGQTKTHSGERKIHNPLTSCIIFIDFPCSPLLQTQFSIFCTHRQRGEILCKGALEVTRFQGSLRDFNRFRLRHSKSGQLKTVCKQLSPWKLTPKPLRHLKMFTKYPKLFRNRQFI